MKLLNVRLDTYNSQRKTGRTFFDINHSNILFDPPPGITTIKTKVEFPSRLSGNQI